jgi:hypothetical protein
MYNIKKSIVTGSVTLLSLVVCGVNSANATTFSLKFLDNSGQQVGSGSFSYNDDEIRCIDISSGGYNPCTSNSSGTKIFVSRPLSSFVATVPDDPSNPYGITTWGYLDGPAWWADPARFQQAGYVFSQRSWQGGFEFGVADNYFRSTLGDPRFPRAVLTMNIRSASDISGSGNWNADGLGYGPARSGTFIAEATPVAVPEPLTMLGSITAVVFGAAFKRKT